MGQVSSCGVCEEKKLMGFSSPTKCKLGYQIPVQVKYEIKHIGMAQWNSNSKYSISNVHKLMFGDKPVVTRQKVFGTR